MEKLLSRAEAIKLLPRQTVSKERDDRGEIDKQSARLEESQSDAHASSNNSDGDESDQQTPPPLNPPFDSLSSLTELLIDSVNIPATASRAMDPELWQQDDQVSVCPYWYDLIDL